MELAAASRREFVMCAPFAKEGVVSEVLSAVPEGVRIQLFTRWRPDEVAAGVSDTQVLPAVRSRGGVVYLYDRLHAKYYRNEHDALIGSANLTATALGWRPNSNLELLVASTDSDIEVVERILGVESVLATEEIAREVDSLAALLPVFAPSAEVVKRAASPGLWIPRLRIPSDLYTAYRDGALALASRSGEAAAEDLSVLELPPGLDRAQFDALVGHRLRNQSLFRQIDHFLSAPRRFGEMRRYVRRILGCDQDQAEESWQTTMRWMFEFMPDRYLRNTFRHSEVVSLAMNEVGADS